MGDTYSAVEVRSTLRTFRGYLQDLATARFDQFGTKLRLFVNFCERDDTFRVITKRLHTAVGDVKEWFQESAAGGAARPLPAGAPERLSHVYKVLFEIKNQRIDVRNFLSTLFTGHTIEDSFRRFSDAWLEAFAAGMDRLFAAIETGLEGKDSVDLEAAVDQAVAGMAAPAAPAKAAPAPAKAAPGKGDKAGKGAAAKPAAAPEPEAKPAKKAGARAAKEPEVGDLVKLLEKSVKGAKDLATKVRGDIETDVKILKLELSKHVPDFWIIQRVAEPLERTGGKIAELAAAIALRAKQQVQ